MSKTKNYLHDLSQQLKNLGHEEAASDVSTLSFDPLDLGFASGKLNLESFSESGDESEIDPEHVKKVLERASLYGFGGECAEAAIAINDVLFNEEGRIVAAINKWLWKKEGKIIGHVAVEWNGSYWDSEGEKDWGGIESWGMLDESDLDYEFEGDKEAPYLVEKIYPSKKELVEMFGGCNLGSMIKKLERADREVRGEV